jgi:hypothetical protein
MKGLFLCFMVVLVGFLQIGCHRLDGKFFVPEVPGYKEDAAEITILKRPLREISGIGYLEEDKLVAINDEAGKIFFVNPKNGNEQVVEFGSKADYEDIVKVANDYYVLISTGDLVLVNANTLKQEKIFAKNFGKRVEFESLYYDQAANQLVLICKECGRDAKEINAWAFDLIKQQYIDSVIFSIPIIDVQRLGKDNSIECKPSAAAINPVTQKLYVIASVGKLLLECNLQGKLENVYGLNPDHFQQPEGIAFAPNGDMYISNEGMQGKATLLKFTYTGR